jgi:hypothetical protein
VGRHPIENSPLECVIGLRHRLMFGGVPVIVGADDEDASPLGTPP